MSDTTEQLKSCTFWQLSPEERAEVIAAAPQQDVWELTMERLDDGHWQFSIPELKTINELLTGGTEKILDYYYLKISHLLADSQSKMKVKVSASPMRINHVTLQKVADDPTMAHAGTYKDTATGMTGWLCGWCEVIFGCAPETIYAYVEPFI